MPPLIKLIDSLFSQHSYLSFFFSFLAGILASLSPCIYPLIPITIGVIGGYSLSSKKRGFVASFLFVLGIAVVYTLLGIISASLGIFLEKILLSYISSFILGFFLLFLGLSFLEIIKLPLFSFSLNYKPKKSLFSIFITGCISSLAITPCIFPILGMILGLISLKKDIIYGGLNLFCFSLGYGLLLMIIGTFTSLISKLPKKGTWLIIIKKSLGILICVIGGYFIIRGLYLL